MENDMWQEMKMLIEGRGEFVCESVDICEVRRNCELKCLVEQEVILGEMASGNERDRNGLEERKCSEAAERASVSNLCCKDEVVGRMEDEFRCVQDKLKLKNEQFNHLEDAYEKLRREFQLRKLEREKERLVAHGKMSSLQSCLDSRTRISKCLQTKLKMRDQALAHEESRRKLVEVQLSESLALFENIYAKCQEEQAKMDQLNALKDEEIATLKYLLEPKDILFKEMEYKNLVLKQEKEDINLSLKGFQEAEIVHAASFQSLTKLQRKFENLEQVHGSCSPNYELKEIEWTSQLERLKAEGKEYLSELSNKETEILDLHKELERCQFSLQSLNEEMDVVVTLVKSEYSEAYSKLLFEHENNQNQIFLMTKDLEDTKNMLEESQKKHRYLEEFVLEVENVNKADLAERTREINFINAELQRWKTDAENVKSSLEEAQEIHKQTETQLQLQLEYEQDFKREIQSLENAVKEHERNIYVLKQHVTSLESALVVKDDTIENLELKNKSYIGIIKELDSKNICLHEKISGLVFDWHSILGEMEGASDQLHEICCQDVCLLAAFGNTEYATVVKEQKMCNEISSHDGRNEANLYSPTSAKLQMKTNEQLPFLETNY